MLLNHGPPRSGHRGVDARLGDAVAAWIGLVQRRAGSVVVLCVALSLTLAAFAAPRLGVNSSEAALFERSANYAQQRENFRSGFPALVDPILVVVDGRTVDLAHDAAEALRARLLRDPGRFPTVYLPGSGPFFERHGLLYLRTEEVSDVSDRLAEVQPYLGTLARDGSVRGLFELLGQTADATARGDLERFELSGVLDEVDASVQARLAGETRDLSWAQLLLGRTPGPRELRRLLLVEPALDFEAVAPAAATIDGLREAIAELGLDRRDGVEIRITGLFPLSQEEAKYVASQARAAGLASFVLVSLVLFVGLRSLRLSLAILATLVAGGTWTAAFAGAAIGHLNLISVAFAVLFIGLSVDFGIHLGIRYRELLRDEPTPEQALREAGRSVGGSLVVCAVTTAIAFYAFVPTDFRGIGELGLIAGTGMFASLIANLTLLPALLALSRPPSPLLEGRPSARVAAAILSLPVRHTRAVAAVTLALIAVSLPFLPRVDFDMNPLRVRDPSAESVRTYDDLLADGMAFPWNISAIADDPESAESLASRLEALAGVDDTLALADYVPSEQPEKLAILADAAFLLLPTLEPGETRAAPGPEEQRRAIADLEQSLLSVAEVGDAVGESAARLRASLAAFRARLERSPDPEAELAGLEQVLLGSLPEQLRILRSSLRAGAVTAGDLPPDLRRQLVAPDGRMRIEVFPRDDLNDNVALAAYVDAVTEVAPQGYGEAIAMAEISEIVVSSFQQALATAALLILAILLLLWRNAVDTALVALPLALATLFTAAAGVALGVPFNFANVIVIPLLLGMGVDSGVHLVHRFRYEPLPESNLLLTSTARAVLFSGLTTIASFGTLGFATHLGLASLGRLLTLGMGLILACNLMVLPVAVVLGRFDRGAGRTAIGERGGRRLHGDARQQHADRDAHRDQDRESDS